MVRGNKRNYGGEDEWRRGSRLTSLARYISGSGNDCHRAAIAPVFAARGRTHDVATSTGRVDRHTVHRSGADQCLDRRALGREAARELATTAGAWPARRELTRSTPLRLLFLHSGRYRKFAGYRPTASLKHPTYVD